MSLSCSHSPRMGMSGSFGCANRLTAAETKSTLRYQLQACSRSGVSRSLEHSPLLPSRRSASSDVEQGDQPNKQHHKSPPPDPQLSCPLLMTILAVTVGSSLQFGCAIAVEITKHFTTISSHFPALLFFDIKIRNRCHEQ